VVDQIRAQSVHTRPVRRIALDVETTGLQQYDRIVTLGAVRIEGEELTGKALHLVFDPRKDSHPEALALHGWDNWTTRFQDLFSDLAPAVRRWLLWADELVCHNAQFDLHYIEREIRKAELQPLQISANCTLEAARAKWPGCKSRLDDCLENVGLARSGARHGALEDAVLAAALFLCMRGHEPRLPSLNDLPAPTNYVPAPPAPGGELPRRVRKRPGESPTLMRVRQRLTQGDADTVA
jgi:DNA polymerase III subunit epsilon